MAKKLGRGLSHLLSGAGEQAMPAGTNKHPEYQELPLKDIKANPDQPRKHFKEADIESLAETLHSVGLIEPVIVRLLKDGSYQLISGERRWRACRRAGFKKIPVIIKQMGDIQALEMAVIENIQREELTPIEEARAYETLLEKTGMKPSQLAHKVGKDRTTITNLIRLLKLPESVLHQLETQKISAGQARPLLSLGDPRVIAQLARKIAEQGWSARRVEDEVARISDPTTRGKKPAANRKGKTDANLRTLEDKLRRRLLSKVSLVHSKKGSGKITLHYANLDDLDRLLKLLGVK